MYVVSFGTLRSYTAFAAAIFVLAIQSTPARGDEAEDLIAVLERGVGVTRHAPTELNPTSFRLSGKTNLERWLKGGKSLPEVPQTASCIGVIVGGTISAGILDKRSVRQILTRDAPAAASLLVERYKRTHVVLTPNQLTLATSMAWSGEVARGFGFDTTNRLQLVGYGAESPQADGPHTTQTVHRGDLVLVGHVVRDGLPPNFGLHWALGVGNSEVLSLLGEMDGGKLMHTPISDMMTVLHTHMRAKKLTGKIHTYVVRSPWAQLKRQTEQRLAEQHGTTERPQPRKRARSRTKQRRRR